jgi:hypothetical protein
VENNIKTTIKNYIEILSGATNVDAHEWIPNCIECLQFALDNEQLLIEKPSLYEDTLDTLQLLYSWIVEDKGYAYIYLRQKFRTIYSGEQIGKALKSMLSKLNCENKKQENNLLVSFTNDKGEFKSTEQILNELSQKWNTL